MAGITIPLPEISYAAPNLAPSRGRESFLGFIRRVNPRYKFYSHCRVLIELLQKVADGEVKRLLVFEPPRHGKSELVSRLFPAYMLTQHPHYYMGLCSYAADLAYGFSRNARNYYRLGGGKTHGDAAAVKQWETERGGGLWAAGVGGPITGKGFHVGVIDDPIKNADDASSDRYRDKQWDWYQSVFLTREEPDAAQVVTLTRWHEDDLAGRIVKQAKETGEVWHACSMEALAMKNPQRFPEHFETYQVMRDVGEALCPQRYSAEKLGKIKENVGTYFWNALYQQRPTPLAGAFWRREWFSVIEEVPKFLRGVGYDWDLAYTEKDSNSASAYVKSGRDRKGNIYILDLDFQWLEFPALISWMRSLPGPHYIEAKATGKSAKQTLSSENLPASEVSVVGGDKQARTALATPRAEAGKVFIARHLFTKLLDDDRQGVLKFPYGSHDDLNDALTQAIQRHTKPAIGSPMLLPI